MTVTVSQFLIGISGALVGVMGWLMVGMYIQKRAHNQQARDAGRTVYFELGANRLTIFIAAEYGVFGPLGRSSYERLLPEITTWLPAAELQALVLAYLGHGGYEQASTDQEVPASVRQAALSGLMEAHRTALELLQPRVFNEKELASLNTYVSAEYMQIIDAAGEVRQESASHD